MTSRQRDVQDILNAAHVDEAEMIAVTPDAYDTTRPGVLVADCTLLTLRVKNSGANQIKFLIEGSVDGVEFDETVQTETTLNAGSAHVERVIEQVYKRVRVLLKNKTSGMGSAASIHILGV
ncbi:MAG: hypothetical protein A3G34_10665 [Candidatus Lindowbacteria bacterium RIFCSPLOWO2_12_FULL_62_27]|nr:MAG: hypothetical protein A3G34_10665 [Candidatus Lindowbacteria bacterium RIFCSPLOWO2_12_FULL_62_27]